MSDLFSFLAETEGGYRRADPETSIAAALERLGGKATDRKRALLEHYRAPAGLTDFELAARMHRQQTSAGKRRGELRDLGLVEATIGRRPAPSGSAAIVWVITEAGRTVIEKLNTDTEETFR